MARQPPQREPKPTGLLSHSGESVDDLLARGAGTSETTTDAVFEHNAGPLPQQAAQGDILGERYVLQELLGSGGFGVVWRALDQLLRREVAVKISRASVERGDALLLREARTVAGLHLSGLVPIYDLASDGENWFVVAELMRGGSLADALRQRTLSLVERVRIVAELAETLHRLHLRGFVHRDVKPGNVLLDEHGRAYLGDFGLAISENETLKQPHRRCGTVKYMSPEQASGRPDLIDGRSDQFSLGVVLYELLTERLPFIDASPTEYLQQIVERPARPPRSVDDALPVELEAICLKTLEKKVGDRYSTMSDLASALRRWLAAQDQAAAPPAVAAPSPTFGRRSALWSGAIVGGGLLLLGLVAVYAAPHWRAMMAPSRVQQLLPSTELPPADAPFQSLPDAAIVVEKTYPLLLEAPRSKLGKSKDGVHYDAEGETLHLSTYGSSMLQLGATQRENYTLRIDLRQAAMWQGQAGVFFGLHPDPATSDAQCAQAILVQRHADATNPEFGLIVVRRQLRIRGEQLGSQPPSGIADFSTQVTAIPPGRSAELELRIENGRLASVRFAGNYLPALSATPINSAFERRFYYGGFGVLASQSSGVTFENASIRIEN